MRKGFTLVEVLAVVTMLSVLMVVIIPSVIRSAEETREEAYKFTITTLKQVTQLYIRNNKEDITNISQIGNTIVITIQDLVDKENLKTPVIDPKTDKEVDLSTPIVIYVKGHNNYEITVGSFVYVEDVQTPQE